MSNPRCRWVRDRLPLLAGDDLVGPDRRRVESHMVGCPECRRHRGALGHAMLALEAASASSPSRSDAPSLWPDLARQIRESRRPHRGSTFGFGFSFAPARVQFRPAFGLILGLLATIGATAAVRNQIAATRADMAINSLPIATSIVTPVVAKRPRAPAPVPSYDLPSPVAENEQPRRFHDNGAGAASTPPEPRDSKATY